MLLNTNDGKTVNFFFLNKKMVDLFKDSSVQISELPNLVTYHEKLSTFEIGYILRLQSLALAKITGREWDVESVLKTIDNSVIQTKIRSSFNDADSKGLLEQLNNCNSFYVKGFGGDNHAILLDVDLEQIPVDWVPLTSKKFSTALLEAIYTRIGYLDIHFKEVSKNTTADFSLRDVYKLINIEL